MAFLLPRHHLGVHLHHRQAPAGLVDAPVTIKDIEYSISSISGKDLEVTKENEKLVIRFAYDKEIPLVEPVYLLLKYKGRSK